MSSKPNLLSPVAPYEYTVFPNNDSSEEPAPWQPPPRLSLADATSEPGPVYGNGRPPSGSLSELFNPHSVVGSDAHTSRTRALTDLDAATDIGPSVSQVGSDSNTSGASSGTTNTMSAALIAKQTLVNEQLRSEVADLRQEMETIRLERSRMGLGPAEEAPPSYTPPVPLTT